MCRTTRSTRPKPGVYVEGHWGQYGPARVVEIAIDYGFTDDDLFLASEKMATMGPSSLPPLSADAEDRLSELCDRAEVWLNEFVSDDNHHWMWEDGEFGYWTIEDEEDV